jgi:spermidine/putrescine-binding protein
MIPMKKLLLAAAILVVAVGMTGCGPSGPKELHFYNWADYIDPELYAAFEEETGIQVVEDTFGSNEDLYAKLQGGATGYDVIVPSDYMVEIMVQEGMLAELDHSRLTTLDNLDPTFTNPPFDPNMSHCLPYFWGTTGIGFYWEDWDEAPDSWAYLFDPELAQDFAGQISLLDDMREVFGAALIYLGYHPGTTNEAELAEALDLLLGVKEYIHALESDIYDDMLLSRETKLAHGWSGDIFSTAVEDENVDYIIPKEGAVMWVDTLCITKDAAADPERLDMAYQWLDFLNRADINATNTNYVWYASPNLAARDGILEEILTYPAIYPDEETFKKLEFLGDVGETTEVYSRMWTEFKAGQ